jgi:ADP-heptose:LPS heptosyltransferase
MKAFDPGNVRTLLIRGTNWVGDSILSLPALKRVRLEFPTARITLLVLPWVAGIYEGCTAIDEIWLYDRQGSHRGLSGRRRLIRELRERRFDAAWQEFRCAPAMTATAAVGCCLIQSRWIGGFRSSIKPITTWIC